MCTQMGGLLMTPHLPHLLVYATWATCILYFTFLWPSSRHSTCKKITFITGKVKHSDKLPVPTVVRISNY